VLAGYAKIIVINDEGWRGEAIFFLELIILQILKSLVVVTFAVV